MKSLILFCSFVFAANLICSADCNTTAGFNHNSDGLIGFFQSASQSDCAIESIEWDFGDGTFSTATNPIHTFPDFGTYEVCIEISVVSSDNQTFTQISCLSVEMGATICSLIPEVELSVVGGQLSAMSIAQANQSTQIISSTWDFGDGTLLEGESVQHEYFFSGTYVVCMQVEAVSGNQSCSAQVCKLVDVSFEVPSFDLSVSEEQTEDCTYELQPSHQFPEDVELVSRVWYHEDQSYTGDYFSIQASSQEPVHVVLKEYYTFRGEEFTKTIEHIIYPQCSEVVLDVESNELSAVTVVANSGYLEIGGSILLDRISVYSINGQLVFQGENIEQHQMSVQNGIHLVLLERNGEVLTRKVLCN